MYLLEYKPKQHEPWNKGKLLGQKPPLKLKEIWAIRIRLQLAGTKRDLALFNLGIDSKLRACDLVRLRLQDVAPGDQVAERTMIMQRKTHRPVQFEITEQTRESIKDWIEEANITGDQYLFPSRICKGSHISTRQYARLLSSWIENIGLNPATYGTHSLRRTKASLIYRRTKNLRAVQLLLGHSKAREHRQVSGNRGRGRSCHSRKHRRLNGLRERPKMVAFRPDPDIRYIPELTAFPHAP